MSNAELILSVRDVKAGYVDENVLHRVSIDVPRGEVEAVIGADGSGKSTLLKSIYGLLRPRGGSLHRSSMKSSRPSRTSTRAAYRS